MATAWSTACAYATCLYALNNVTEVWCVGRKALWTQHQFDGCIFGSIPILFWHSDTQPHWIERKVVQLEWVRCVADAEYAYADKMDQANTDARTDTHIHAHAYYILREREAKRSHNASKFKLLDKWLLNFGCLESRRYQCYKKSQWKKCVPSFIVIKRFICHHHQTPLFTILLRKSTSTIKHCCQ